MNIPQPLVYFQYNSDFEIYRNNGYTEKQNDQAVFVGDTKKIYTHGEVFDCNNTVYNDTELRGLISDVDGKIDNSVETLTGLIDGVNDDLDNINNWSESDIRSSINTMMSEANWINNFISTNNIQTGTPFTVTDVDNRLKTVGVLNNDGTLGWSTLQQNYNTISGTVNSLSTRVSDLETGGVDEEALQARLEGYIDDEIAGLNLDTTYARLDDSAITWLRSGFNAQTSPQLTFSQMYSAATKDWSGDITTATAGVKTEIESELDGYVATAELATRVENAGFAKTSGVVAKSDLDSSVAALFSSTSSTKNALDNFSAGFVTSSDLQSAQATMVASSELNGRIEDYLTSSQNTSGKWAAGVNASVSTANTNASNAVSTANSANTAVSTLFATNGAGTAAISSYVTDWWSGVTISGDKVDLTGKQLNMAFGQTAEEYESVGPLLSINENSFEIRNVSGYYNNNSVEIRPYALWVKKVTDSEMPAATDRLVQILPNEISINHWSRNVGWAPYAHIDEEGFHGDVSCDYIHLDHELQIAANEGARIEFETGIQLGNIFNQDENNPGYYDGLQIKSSDGRYETLISSQGMSIDDNTNGSHTWIYPNLIVTPQLSQTSDRNLKDIVSDVNLTVEQIAEAPAVEFTWKKDQSEDKQHNIGTIAQYWQVVLPEVVGETEDGKLTMQYSNAAMVSAIVTAKEVVALKEEIEELKRQIAELKNN